MSLKFCYFFLCFFLGAMGLEAQKRAFSYQHLGTTDGLSNSNVFAIRQKDSNTIFVATENGVYKYDGYSFVKINTGNSLRSNFIRNITFDESGNLIIVNRREGIYEYNISTETTRQLSDINFKTAVDELVYDNDYIYTLTDQISVSAFQRERHVYTEDNIKKQIKTNQAYALFHSSIDKKTYVGRSNGIYEYTKGKQIRIYENINSPVYSISQKEDGTLYLGSSNKIYIIRKDSIRSIPIDIKKVKSIYGDNESNISKLIIDKYDRIWFTAWPEDNLYVYEDGNVYDVFDLLDIDKALINCLYKDKDENIWVGTFNDGIYFIQNPFFKNISFYNVEKNLPVTCAAIMDQIIVTGTSNGLFTFNTKNNAAEVILPPDNLFNENINNFAVTDNTIFYTKSSSFSNKDRTLYIGGKDYLLSPVIGRLLYLESPGNGILADWTGNIYAVEQQKNRFIVRDTLVSYPDYRIKINSILKLGNALYIGTSEGLSIKQLGTGELQSFSAAHLKFSINHIIEHNGKIYLAHENGITNFTEGKLIQQIGEIPLSTVKRIYFYKGKIWLATLDGLYICNEDFTPICIYNKSKGLLSNTVNDIIFSGNTCCICTDRGVTTTTVQDLMKKHHLPYKVLISTISIDDKTSVAPKGTLRLSSDVKDIMVNFSSPLYTKPNKQLFRYKLDNGKWINLENTQVHLASLTGGNHELQIVCTYDGINWSEPTQLSIVKIVPFMESPLFYLLLIVGAFIVVSLIIWIWVKRVKTKALRKVNEERQVNLLKHQAMNSLMSPHFIFNSLTSIQNYINTNNGLMASEYLAKFSRLIRMIIEKASQSDILLSEELIRLGYYLELEKERFKAKFDYQLSVDPQLDPNKIMIPNMIIQPYVENAIIHGILPKHEHGVISIHFSKKGDDFIQILIEDNGIGYEKTKLKAKEGHKSLGTRTIENILELNTKLSGKTQHVTIVDKSTLETPGQGTLITIILQN